MRYPAQALAWELWHRNRWGLSAALAYFAALAALLQLVPGAELARRVGDLALREALAQGHLRAEELQYYLGSLTALPLMAGLLFLFAAAAYGTSKNLSVRGSTYPARAFTLPVSTASLVAWPMVLGGAAVAAAAGGIDRWVLRPWGVALPLHAPPGLLAAALLAWAQAVTWTPFRTDWFKSAAAVAMLGCLAGLAAADPAWGVPRGLPALVLAGSLPAAYAAALAGVSRARRGEQADGSRLVAWLRTVRACNRPVRRPFATAARAQFWYEWRLHGAGLPLLVGCVLPFLLALLWFQKDPLAVTTCALALGFPPFIATMSVATLSEFGGKEYLGVSTFTAARPATCAALVAAKLQMAALSALAAYALILTVVPLGVVCAGRWGEVAGAWHGARQHVPAARLAGLALLAVALLVLLTWKHLVENLFAGLTGRGWIVNVLMLSGLGLYAAGGAAGGWLYFHPEHHTAFFAALPWLLGGLVAVKVAAGGWACGYACRLGLLSRRTAAVLAVLWLGAAAGLAVVVSAAVPGARRELPLVVLGVLLFLPCARLSLAPLALVWNRHR